jgi:hypothetical protein
MAAGIEQQIFQDASIPEDQVDDAVSKTIRDQESPSPASPPPAPAAPGPSDPFAGEAGDRNGGLLEALLRERERRQEALSEKKQLAEQLERYRKQETKPSINERLFVDPEGTLNELRQEWTSPLQQEIASLRLDHNFSRAQLRHGDTWGEAWKAWYEAVSDGKDAALYFGVLNAQDPGEAMVEWYRRNRLWSETGGDLDAYKQRVIDEYLAAQGGSFEAASDRPRAPNGQFVSTARPPAPQRMPTSISRMGSTGNTGDDEDLNDGSDAAIFAAARPKSRGQR